MKKNNIKFYFAVLGNTSKNVIKNIKEKVLFDVGLIHFNPTHILIEINNEIVDFFGNLHLIKTWIEIQKRYGESIKKIGTRTIIGFLNTSFYKECKDKKWLLEILSELNMIDIDNIAINDLSDFDLEISLPVLKLFSTKILDSKKDIIVSNIITSIEYGDIIKFEKNLIFKKTLEKFSYLEIKLLDNLIYQKLGYKSSNNILPYGLESFFPMQMFFTPMNHDPLHEEFKRFKNSKRDEFIKILDKIRK